MISSYLYEHRFGPYFVEPVVAGLDPKTKEPFLCASDLLGSGCFAKDFVVSGTAEQSLYGTCETFFKEDMNEEELFETISQCLMAAVDRDCLSGWGGIVYVLTPERMIVRRLKGRQD
jgi:20S proteasome subunit beta 3